MNSCLSLAVMHEGDEVVTIEGLGAPGSLHPLQAAFADEDALQCGYCTPGQICSAVGALDEWKRNVPSHVTRGPALAARAETSLGDEEIRERMSGNLCRCAAYPHIVRAVASVAPRAKEPT